MARPRDRQVWSEFISLHRKPGGTCRDAHALGQCLEIVNGVGWGGPQHVITEVPSAIECELTGSGSGRYIDQAISKFTYLTTRQITQEGAGQMNTVWWGRTQVASLARTHGGGGDLRERIGYRSRWPERNKESKHAHQCACRPPMQPDTLNP